MFSLRYLLPALAAVKLAAAQCSNTATQTLQNSGDASAVATCTTFSGSIAVATSTTENIELGDTLTKIDGDLSVVGANKLGLMSAGALEEISGTFRLNGVRTLSTLTFPRLTTVDAIEWKVLPGLSGLDFGTGVQECRSVMITDTQLENLDGIDLAEVESLVIQSNGILTDVTLDITNVTTELTMSSNGLDMNVDLSSLKQAKNMLLQNCGNIKIPQLQKVTGAFDMEENAYQTLEAPKLTEVGSTLTIKKNPKLSGLDMPKLNTLGGGFVIGGNPELVTIDGLDNLETINGNLDFSGQFDTVELPKLASVKGAFNMQSGGDIQQECDKFESMHGNNQPIRGKFNCDANDDDPTNLAGGTSSGDGASSSSSGVANPFNIPADAMTGFTGLLVAILGML